MGQTCVFRETRWTVTRSAADRQITVEGAPSWNRENSYRVEPPGIGQTCGMQGMTDEMTIGQRVAFYRRRRGLSQDVLAGLVGKTAEWLRKVETDRASLDRLSVIQRLARALDVSLGNLIGEPALLNCAEGSGRETIPTLRAALHDFRHLASTLSPITDDEPPSLDAITYDLHDAWGLYQASKYGKVALRLPDLLHRSLKATRVFDGSKGQQAQVLAAYSHQIATVFLTKLGESDLAWIAAARGLAAANESNDHVVIGSLGRAAAHSLMAIGEFPQAIELACTTANIISRRLPQATPELLSVYGSLHLVCALAAAREGDRAAAREHIGEADKVAERLGQDANYVWTAFGPTNVLIHETVVAMELGDVQRAIGIGVGLDTSVMPIERRVRHSIETARALMRRNQIDGALDLLLDAERVGSDQIRYHRLSRAIVRDILTRARPPRRAIELSSRMGIGSDLPQW